jgi:hypothetical protein
LVNEYQLTSLIFQITMLTYENHEYMDGNGFIKAAGKA